MDSTSAEKLLLPHCFDHPSPPAPPRMKLFLIRHGETEHNIAGLLAGVTDSNLTHHGVLQTQRLAAYLVKDRKLRFTHVYASDLKRAFMTADEICKIQNEVEIAAGQIETARIQLLREQDFGSLELVSWSSRRDSPALNPAVPNPLDPDYKARETTEAMKIRADSFLDDFMMPLLAVDDSHKMCVAIISHGIFLGTLWRSFLGRLRSKNVILDTSLALGTGNHLPYLRPGWSNTGFLEAELKSQSSSVILSTTDQVTSSRPGSPKLHSNEEDHEPKTSKIIHLLAQESKNTSPKPRLDCEADPANVDQSDTRVASPLKDMMLTIKKINGKNHLLNFKRARGGLGSVTFDKRQTKLEGFFKKTKTESKGHDYHLRSKKDAT